MGATQQFAGGRRFELTSRLGAGGRGLVYRARDRDSGAEVALKTLRALGPDEILRLKREFRQLRSIRHPNVIRLHELAEEDGHWFYTMELVRGLPLLSHVRPDGELDPARLRTVARQVASALAALHAAGSVHGDVKPSNILIEHTGRAVILDPGISLRGRGSSSGDAFGTPEYMAPEQGDGRRLAPSADWYALGCTLYEALTGAPPFEGTRMQILGRKAAADVAAPDTGPAELRALIAELLRRDPRDRPSAAAVLAAVGAEELAVKAPTALLGREPELAAIARVWDLARAGTPALVFVHGAPGLGKTALLDAACAALPDRQVLRGGCDPHESMSFRAVDSLIDGMVDYLAELGHDECAALLPARSDVLARAFPVMRRVDAVVMHGPRREADDDPAQGAALAHALAELVAAIARREGGLAIVLDDLDLADDDSVSLLAGIIAQPPGAQLLVVGAVRFATDAVPWLDTVDLAARAASVEVEHLVLESVAPVHAQALSRAAHGTRASAAHRAVTASPVPGDPLAGADPDARALATLLAVAGSPPLPGSVVCRAMGWDLARFAACAGALDDARLVRRDTAHRSSPIGLHDESVGRRIVATLHGDDRRSLHRQLANALAAAGSDERAGEHFAAAGDDRRAARALTKAGQRAVARLAYASARRLFSRALGHLPAEDPRRAELLTLRADCLQATGLLSDAADSYLEAATLSETAAALELRRCAADCLIRNGHAERGLEVQRGVLAALGVNAPATPRQALRSLALGRIRVRLRGLRYQPRAPDAVPVELALRTDALLGAGLELGAIDFVRGRDLQTRALLAALETGDERRIAKAIIAEATYAGGRGDARRCDALLERASVMAEALGSRYIHGYLTAVRGIMLILRGQWEAGTETCDAGIARLRSGVVGVDWEINATEHFVRWALHYRGAYRELARRVRGQLHAADARGDRFTGASLRSGFGSIAWLVRDEPELALEQCRVARGMWSQPQFLNPNWLELLARANALLYLSRGPEAAALLEERWSDIQGAMLLRVESVRVEAFFARARAELGDPAPAAVARAGRWQRKLAREKLPWAHALALLVDAGRARRSGDEERATRSATRASAMFDQQGATAFAQLARLGVAELTGDEAGRSAVERWAADAGISRVDRMGFTFSPGLVAADARAADVAIEAVEILTLRPPAQVTTAWVEQEIARLEQALPARGRIGLIFDASAVEGFDLAARARLTNWIKSHRTSIVRIGMITDRATWRLVARVGGRIVNLPLRIFARADECLAWVEGGA